MILFLSLREGLQSICSPIREVKIATFRSNDSDRINHLAAMGEMAAKIAHEVRNPLGSIELLASLIEKESEEGRHREMAGRILSSVKNLNSVVSNLLFYAKAPKPTFKPFPIVEHIDELLEFIDFLLLKNRISLDKSLGGGGTMVNGDVELIKQVLLNVLYNAIQAMPEGGKLFIKTDIVQFDDNVRGERRFFDILIQDSGIGIAEKNIDKIYAPFFTTRDKGTGLGLSIAHNIVESHGGVIEVESKVGSGTTFKILLPIE